jgi:hypothetical protein
LGEKPDEKPDLFLRSVRGKEPPQFMGHWLSIWIIEIRVDFGTQKWELFEIVPEKEEHGIPTVASLRASGGGNGLRSRQKPQELKQDKVRV